MINKYKFVLVSFPSLYYTILGGLNAMSKLSSLAKDASRTCEYDLTGEEKIFYESGFEKGFEAAFKELKEQTTLKIAHLEQYPMMTERIFALKAYIKTMDEMLEEMK
jgi:hypothetical protein